MSGDAEIQGEQVGPTGESDRALVRRVLAGDAAALDELGRRLASVPRLIGEANRRLPRPLPAHELGDLSQDVVVLIWRKLETFEGSATLEGWAWRFGTLELRNRVRDVARRRVRSGASLADLDIDPAAPAPKVMRYDADELEAALGSLSSEVSEVIRLKHERGLMFKEIAEVLRIPENTAKTRYYRGLAKLEELLGRNDDRAHGPR